MRILGLVDCNSFYAACEKVFRPELRARPVVVLSNNDGCVVARSSEAKALGIAMGVHYFQVRPLCRRAGVAVFSSNYALYGDMSRRVMDVLGRWTPRLEVYSIDEAFLDFTGIRAAADEDFGRRLAQTVRQWTGIPVSIGIAPTKTLAKAANRCAKRLPGGVRVLLDPADQRRELDGLPVEEVWGVSDGWGARLRRLGIRTAGQLRDADPGMLRRGFSIVLERLARELRGESCLALEDAPPPKKNISVSRSFGRRVEALADLEEAVACYAARAGEKLRAQGSAAGGIYVYLRTDGFNAGAAQYANAWTADFPVPATYTAAIIGAALSGLRRIYRPGYLYKKAGVILLELQDSRAVQGDLFQAPARPERDRSLMAAVDGLNRALGRDTVAFAAQGIARTWALRAEMRSPRYTTRWNELPRAAAV